MPQQMQRQPTQQKQVSPQIHQQRVRQSMHRQAQYRQIGQPRLNKYSNRTWSRLTLWSPTLTCQNALASGLHPLCSKCHDAGRGGSRSPRVGSWSMIRPGDIVHIACPEVLAPDLFHFVFMFNLTVVTEWHRVPRSSQSRIQGLIRTQP